MANPGRARAERQDIGARLRRFRAARGVSVRQLALKAYMGEKTINRCESGERVITLDEALRLCEILQVSIEQLTGTPCSCANCVHPPDLKDLI